MNRTERLTQAENWIAAHWAEYIAEVRGVVRVFSVRWADLAQSGTAFGLDGRSPRHHGHGKLEVDLRQS